MSLISNQCFDSQYLCIPVKKTRQKNTQIIAYYANGTQTSAQVDVLYQSYCQTEISWHLLWNLSSPSWIPLLPLTHFHYIHYLDLFLNTIWSVWPIWVCNIAGKLSWKTCHRQAFRLFLKRAKCTVCLSSHLLRSNPAFTRRSQQWERMWTEDSRFFLVLIITGYSCGRRSN